MKSRYFCNAGALVVALSACGGGGSGGGPDAGTTYPYTPAQVNAQSLTDVTIVDNSGNTIDETIRETVTAINGDGTFVIHRDDPNNNSVTVNGTTYAVTPEDVTINGSGQTLEYSYRAAGGNTVLCTESPHGSGPDYPVAIGTAWTLDFTIQCGAGAAILYVQTGTVVGLETVTVPAGTFTAVKLQSTVVWTDLGGTVHNQSITNWRDALTGRSVKQIDTMAYSGTPLVNGYPVSRTTILMSRT